MRITIATSGRFHVADLARELIRHWHDVQFYSIVPRNRLEAFGIPRQHQHCHLAAVAPLVEAQRKLRLPRPQGFCFGPKPNQYHGNQTAFNHCRL